MYLYFENGYKQKISMRKAYRLFSTIVDDNQKSQGTTFTTWMKEMERMEILIGF